MTAPQADTHSPDSKPETLGVRLRQRLRSFGRSSTKRAGSVLRVGVAVGVFGGMFWGVRTCHPEPSPALSDAEGTKAVRLAILGVTRAVAGNPSPPPPETLGRRTVHAPVFVTVYGPDRQLRLDPVLGTWSPTEEQPELSLAQAILEASRQAGQKLRARGRRSLGRAHVKLDLSGPARPVWPKAAAYLDWIVDPGRDGLELNRPNGKAWWLPSWTVERGLTASRALDRLESEIDARAPSSKLSRFRTTSFIQAVGSEDRAQRIVRANVLQPSPTAKSVEQSIAAAASYLARAVRSDGTYCYTYRPLLDECAPDYNLLRHAGTTYSLYQALGLGPDPTLFDAAERATAWLRSQVRTVDGDRSRAYLLDAGRAKLGAVGLSLMALVERERVVRDGRDRKLNRSLADFLISQQRNDGYFESYFAYKPGVHVPERNSIYYPGEAVLGLVRLYRIDPEPRFFEAALLGAEFLVKKRWRWAGIELYVPPDAWLTQAIADLDAVRPADWLRDYAYEIVELTETTMLRAEDAVAPDLVGGPAAGVELPRVTPAGARAEGSTAAWTMAERRGEREAATRWRDLTLRAAAFQLGHQYSPENSYFLAEPERAQGAFRGAPDDLEVRIDYVQHTLSGLIGTLPMLKRGTR